MINVLSLTNKRNLIPINNKEKDLQKLITENWELIFPHLLFIKSEFELVGKVRSKDDKSGRIDILAFNSSTKSFVVIELKRDFNRTILGQASDYREFIEDNFDRIYLLVAEKFDISLPKYSEIDRDNTETILVAKSFSDTDINKAKKEKSAGLITLIRYEWVRRLVNSINISSDDFFIFEYLNNFSHISYNYIDEPLQNQILSDEEIEKMILLIKNSLDQKIKSVQTKGNLFEVTSQLNEIKYPFEYDFQHQTFNNSFRAKWEKEISVFVIEIDNRIQSKKNRIIYNANVKDEIELFLSNYEEKLMLFKEICNFLSYYGELTITSKSNIVKDTVMLSLNEYTLFITFHTKAGYDIIFMNIDKIKNLIDDNFESFNTDILSLSKELQNRFYKLDLSTDYFQVKYNYSYSDKSTQSFSSNLLYLFYSFIHFFEGEIRI